MGVRIMDSRGLVPLEHITKALMLAEERPPHSVAQQGPQLGASPKNLKRKYTCGEFTSYILSIA